MTESPNREWHRLHPRPETSAHEELMAWHLEHSKNCSCYAAGPDVTGVPSSKRGRLLPVRGEGQNASRPTPD
ncbi:MAG: hypothetical protein AB7T32_19460 [Dehalococcoidia bacterium]